MSNWDTEETLRWIESEEEYWILLKNVINDEMAFIYTLYVIIQNINIFKIEGDGNGIDSANVNGNELYIEFCKLNENEVEGWK